MAYEYSFMDNQVIGVDHLNKLAKRFVASGIADPFANGVPYNVSKINDIVKANGTSGVVPNSIATLRVTKTNGNTVSINTGTAFFANGSTIDVTSPESLNFTPGVKNYIYLKSDMAQNKNYPACTTAQPTGDCVLLAEIDYAGTVTDKRVYAKGKLPGYCSNSNVMLQTELMFYSTGEDGRYHTFTNVANRLEFGINNYTMIFIAAPSILNMGGAALFGNMQAGDGLFYRIPGYQSGTGQIYLATITNDLQLYIGSGEGSITIKMTFDGNGVTIVGNGRIVVQDYFKLQIYVA